MRQMALGMRLRADATFASFAAGSNGECVAAVQVAPGPLWLCGGTGAGKTHLLQAACAAAYEAAYIPLQGTASLPPAALAGFETCRVLCIDDVDAVAGDLEWEQALFRLYNEAMELRTRLIFAAQTAPRQPAWRLDDWRSRAAACMVYQLHELDDDGRADALRRRAGQRGLDLPQDAAEFLLRRMPRDLASLYVVLDQLDEAALVAQRRLTVPFIRSALETLAGTKP